MTLDGQASHDDEWGAIRRYHWEQVGGPAVALVTTDQARASFVMPSEAVAGSERRFRLTVTDDVGLQDSAEVTVQVQGAQNTGGGGGSSSLGIGWFCWG
ncbi:MAG: hypothetical protein R3E89_01370 [Thiolinea sp.]